MPVLVGRVHLTTRSKAVGNEFRKARKKRKQSRRNFTCECNKVLVLFTTLSVLFFFGGMSMCFMGYHSASLMGLPDNAVKPKNAEDQLNEEEMKRYRFLYNFRITGPIIMGFGGFGLLCAIVVAYQEEKTKAEDKSWSKGDEDYDVYERAIKKYRENEREVRRRNTENSDDNSKQESTTDVKETQDKPYRFERRQSSIKSLENALMNRLGGMVSVGIFSRRPSMMSNHSSLLHEEILSQKDSPHQILEISGHFNDLSKQPKPETLRALPPVRAADPSVEKIRVRSVDDPPEKNRRNVSSFTINADTSSATLDMSGVREEDSSVKTSPDNSPSNDLVLSNPSKLTEIQE